MYDYQTPMTPEPGRLPPQEQLAVANQQIAQLHQQLSQQAQRLAYLDQRLTYSLPDTNLLSPNYMTRAFAVWGHFFVSNLLITIVINCILAVVFLILTVVFGIGLSEIFGTYY